MKLNFPETITQENFQETWAAADEFRRKAKRRRLAGKIVPFFSNFVFTLLVLIAGNGLIHDHIPGEYGAFLETLPGFIPAWELWSSHILAPGQGLLTQAILCLTVIYLLSFVAGAVLHLLVMGLYHPKPVPVPNEAHKENGKQLLFIVREGRKNANETQQRSFLWSIVYFVGVAILFCMYTVQSSMGLEDYMVILTAKALELLSAYGAASNVYYELQAALLVPCLLFYGLAIYLPFVFLNLLHNLSVQLLYRCDLPYSHVMEAERYSLYPEGPAAPGAMAELRDKALELELLGAIGKAKEMLAEAAHGGDALAMEHYARHFLVPNQKMQAKYWLQRCIATGNASENAQEMMKALKRRKRIKVTYLK